MKTVIVYYSQHHGNTKMLVDKMASECGAELIKVSCPQPPHTQIVMGDG